MSGKEVTSSTTLFILLGASEWPQAAKVFQQASPESFLNSANGIREYFSENFGILQDNFLDLFDSELNSIEQIKRISKFLDKCTLDEKKDEVRDLIIYYIGHGSLTSAQDQKYFLAIRDTSEELLGPTGLNVDALADPLKRKAQRIRRFVILDCCFSARAFSSFQANLKQITIQKVSEVLKGSEGDQRVVGFPSQGTTLLCSSGSEDLSFLTKDQKFTTFTKNFLDVVKDLSIKTSHITLRGINQKIKERLTEDDAIPEIHTPDQAGGDIADIPFLPRFSSLLKPFQGVYEEFSLKLGIQCYVLVSESERKRQRRGFLEEIVRQGYFILKMRLSVSKPYLHRRSV